MVEQAFAQFEFAVQSLDETTFTLLKFDGVEELSRPFEFTIEAFSTRAEIDLLDVVGQSATLAIQSSKGSRVLHGAVAAIEAGNEIADGRYFYRVTFVPRLWLKARSRHNQIHQAMSVIDVLRVELTGTSGKGVKDGSALHLQEGRDFEFRLSGDYPQRDYLVQWNESDLDFFHRLLETHGLYYYFDHSGGRDKLVICDWKVFLPAFADADKYHFHGRREHAGVDELMVTRLSAHQTVMAGRVVHSDHNLQQPRRAVQGEASAAARGIGVVSSYGDNVPTSGDAERLAKRTAELIKTQAHFLEGDSNCHLFEPGRSFELEGHFRKAANRRYRVTKLRHEGHTDTPAATDLRSQAGRRARYANRFECLPDDVEFRLDRRTPLPRVDGIVSARIDAEGSGGAAEIDEQGRYKVLFFFDLSGSADGRATCWLPLATPFGGPSEGMHFPLRKGAEVVVSFLNGDPDRPVITGVVPTRATPNVVTSGNRMNYVTKTPGGVTQVIGNRLSTDAPASGLQQMGHPGMARSGAAEAAPVSAAGGTVRRAQSGTADAAAFAAQPLDQQLGTTPAQAAATANANYSATLVESDGSGNGSIVGYYRLGDSAEEYDKESNGPFYKVETEDHYAGEDRVDAKEFKVFQYVDGGALNVTYGDSYTYVRGSNKQAVYDGNGILRKWSWDFESTGGNIDFDYSYARSYDVTVGSQFEVTAGNKVELFGGTQTEINVGTQLELNVGLATSYNLAGKFEFGHQFTYEHVEGETIEFAKDKDVFASNSITIGVADFTQFQGTEGSWVKTAALAGGGIALVGELLAGAADVKSDDESTYSNLAFDTFEMGAVTSNIALNALAYSYYRRDKAAYARAKTANSGAQLRLGTQGGHSWAKLETGQHCEVELHDEDSGSIVLEAGDYRLTIANTGLTVEYQEAPDDWTELVVIDKDQFGFQTSDAANTLEFSDDQCRITTKSGTKITTTQPLQVDNFDSTLGGTLGLKSAQGQFVQINGTNEGVQAT